MSKSSFHPHLTDYVSTMWTLRFCATGWRNKMLCLRQQTSTVCAATYSSGISWRNSTNEGESTAKRKNSRQSNALAYSYKHHINDCFAYSDVEFGTLEGIQTSSIVAISSLCTIIFCIPLWIGVVIYDSVRIREKKRKRSSYTKAAEAKWDWIRKTNTRFCISPLRIVKTCFISTFVARKCFYYAKEWGKQVWLVQKWQGKLRKAQLT